MKLKLNNIAFFKAVTLISIITSLVVGLIFFTQNVEKTSILDDFSSNSYQYTSYSSNEVANEIYQNGNWYIENTNITTWVLLGLDKYKQELENEDDNTTTQADFIFLVVFDNEEKTYQSVQINRDTMIDIDVLSLDASSITGSVFAQITLAHAYGNTIDEGSQNVIRAVTRLFYDTEIDYYLSFTLDIVSVVNDAVGGVQVEILHDFSSQYPQMIVGQTVTLTGEQALSYVQQRYSIDEQTNEQRMQRQIQYLEALQVAINEKKTDTQFTLELLLAASDYIYTDASFTKLQNFVNQYIDYDHIAHHSIEGETVLGEQFVEFYADKDQLINLVLDLFYLPLEKTNN